MSRPLTSTCSRLPFRERPSAQPSRIIAFAEFRRCGRQRAHHRRTDCPPGCADLPASALQASQPSRCSRPRPRARHLPERDPSFLEAERALRFGHSVHPTLASRDEFTLTDSRRFAPEYGRGFPLRWWSAAPEAVVQGSARTESAADLCSGLATATPPSIQQSAPRARAACSCRCIRGRRRASRSIPRSDALFRTERLRDHGHAGAPWYATTSLRSLYAPQARFMLKHSLSLRLTNSLRPHQGGRRVHARARGRCGAARPGRRGDRRALAVFPRPRRTSLPRPPRGRRKAAAADDRGAARQPVPRGGQRPAAVLAALCRSILTGGAAGWPITICASPRAEGSAGAGPVEAVALRWFERFLAVTVGPILEIQSRSACCSARTSRTWSSGWRMAGRRDLLPRLPGHGLRARIPACAPRGRTRARPGSRHLLTSAEAARIMAYYLVVNSVFAVVGRSALPDWHRRPPSRGPEPLRRCARRERSSGQDLPAPAARRPGPGEQGQLHDLLAAISTRTPT